MTASLFSYLQPGNSGQDTNFTANLNSVCRRNFPNWIFSPRSRSPELSRRPERAKAPSELISRSPNTQKPVPSTSCAQIQDLQCNGCYQSNRKSCMKRHLACLLVPQPHQTLFHRSFPADWFHTFQNQAFSRDSRISIIDSHKHPAWMEAYLSDYH